MESLSSTGQPSSRTRSSLLRRLRNREDAMAWEQFASLYRDFVRRIAAAAGLSSHDAEDVAQEVLAKVSSNIHQFEPRPRLGAFRNWLKRLTHWRTHDHRRRASRFPCALHPAGDDAEPLEGIPSAWPDPAAELESASRLKLVRMALRRLQRRFNADTLQIFELHVVDGWDVEKVVQFLGVQPHSVYLAKVRIAPALRREVGHLCNQLPVRFGR